MCKAKHVLGSMGISGIEGRDRGVWSGTGKE